ncbi:TraB family protein [Methanocaldococcus lauensis]|uniref:TraB family protein n=1 Tax=Methanocaldococcus lauensis TaxID=2546128 RepID=A0A8D6SUV2_9EURY|nr:TraB family protein [Methanocaldococcus lauensis]CAB3288922.1 TraB family protein [Methanocaldococcus lauensis]
MKHIRIFNGVNECDIYLIGTAHVSKDSVKEVEEVITNLNPDGVAVELDYKRFLSLISEENKKIDIKKVLKEGNFIKFFVYLILANSQKKIGESFGINPGSEMKKSIEIAQKNGIPIYLIDREIDITLSRLLDKMSFREKIKILLDLLNTEGENLELNENLLNEMVKNPEKFTKMLKDISPTIYEVLVDERDRYMAKELFELSKGKNSIVAVIGAGHVEGVIRYLKQLENGEDIDIYELTKVKRKNKRFTKILTYGISFTIFLIFLYAIYYAFNNPELLKMITFQWVLFTGGLSALGVLLARGKLITALIAFLSAPITTLIPLPLAAVGTIAGLVELKYREITDKDIVGLLNAESIKELFNNNLFKVLLVATLSNIGASIGVFYCLGKFVGFL